MNKVAFSHLLTIYRASQFAADGKSASVKVVDEAVVDALNVALHESNIDDSGITADDDPDNINIGDVIRLLVEPPKISLGYLARNFEDFLRMRRVAFIEPKNYFLIREGYSKADENPPDAVLRYRKVLELIELLSKCAAYLDKDRGDLVFIKGGKYPVPVDYTAGELASANVDAINKILDLFVLPDDAHKEAKLAILAEAAMGLLEGVAVGRRFRTLLLELSELTDKFSDGYKLFLANFSYDKVRDELQAWKVDYTGKIHKAFSDIQNQLLSIPVATVVVATQLKPVLKDQQAIFLANVAVIVGAWIFSVLFLLLCRNQGKTLDVLKGEIDRQEDKMRADYEIVLEMFQDVFTSLRDRVTDQERVIFAVRIILGVCFVIAHWFAWQLSKGYLLS
ncbi:hypothetical protein LJR289_003078 [Pseudoduganella sp. LjRoot289]|uniref:hypothetical protein n=1 Tax=Pseudoduganella sp. LjRoot289 TaxID=3342314 RepID=UPI003ECE6EF9